LRWRDAGARPQSSDHRRSEATKAAMPASSCVLFST
jgi:hypothetical protein